MYFHILILLGLLGSLALQANAHLNSVSFSTITIEDATLSIEVRSTLICVLELFPVDVDGDQILTKAELTPAEQVMFFYLNNKIKVLNGGSQMPMRMKNVRFEVGPEDSYVIYDLTFPREFPQQPVLIMNNIQEETDPYHRNISVVHMEEKEYLFVFTQQNYLNSGRPEQLTPLRKRAPRPRGPMSATESISPAT